MTETKPPFEITDMGDAVTTTTPDPTHPGIHTDIPDKELWDRATRSWTGKPVSSPIEEVKKVSYLVRLFAVPGYAYGDDDSSHGYIQEAVDTFPKETLSAALDAAHDAATNGFVSTFESVDGVEYRLIPAHRIDFVEITEA